MLGRLFYGGPPFGTLYQDYARRHRVDDRAPIQASDAVVINAPSAAVWKVVINVAGWPAFNPLFRGVHLVSDVAAGARASFRLNGFPITATFADVEPGRELTWVGVALWTRAIDRLVLEPSEGATRLTMHESIAGAFVPLMLSRARLHAQHQASLKRFKLAAERETAAAGHGSVAS